MNKAPQALREALYETGLVQPIELSGRGGNVSCLCRQIPGHEKSWIRVVDSILEVAEENKIDVHVCRRYIRKNDRMVFGWFLGVEAKSAKALVEAIDLLVPVLKRAQEFILDEPDPVVRKPARPYADKTPESIKRALALDGINIGTVAPQRDPTSSGPDPVAPKNVVPALRVVNSAIDNNGKRTIIEEMPLPHVYGSMDMNKPRPGSIKGATGYTGG